MGSSEETFNDEDFKQRSPTEIISLTLNTQVNQNNQSETKYKLEQRRFSERNRDALVDKPCLSSDRNRM